MSKWDKLKIREFAITQSGGTPSTARIDFWDGDVPWINSGELKDCKISKASKYITKLGLESSSARLFPKGTVVIALTGATTAKLGILEIETSTNQSVTGILPNKNYNPAFLFYQLLFLRREILSQSLGTAQPHINKRIVDEININFPPLHEQEVIVSKIEQLLSELENGKQQLETAQQQLKVYRQSLLKWAFEGKLTNENVKEGELPKGWKWVKLGEVAEVKRGKSKNRPRNEPKLYGGRYPFAQTGDIRNANGGYINTYTQTYSELGLQQSKLWNKGTLCITIAANIGETAILGIDACFPDSVVGLVCNEKLLLNKYTNYFFISHKSKLEESAPATAQKNINVEILEKVLIPLPSLEEQHRIVDELESKLTVCDKIEETITNSLQQAETLRQSILKKAFEGKLI